MRKLQLSLVIAVVVVPVCATVFVYWFFSGDGLRRAIEQQATAWLGQPVTVGRASAGLFPRPAIRLGDVQGTLTESALESQALDGGLDLSLSEELLKQAGTDLARFTREGNRVVLPARIGGTIAAPRITIDAATAATRGPRNEVQRRLKGLFEGFGR